jgi:hypothetical protein
MKRRAEIDNEARWFIMELVNSPPDDTNELVTGEQCIAREIVLYLEN